MKATDEPLNSPQPEGAGSGHPGSFHPALLGSHQDLLQTPRTNTPAAKSGTEIREENSPALSKVCFPLTVKRGKELTL